MLRLTVVSFLSSFDRDPFRAHNEHMRHMMRSFSEPFGGHFMPSITDGRDRGRRMPGQPSTALALRDEHRVRAWAQRHCVHIFSHLFGLFTCSGLKHYSMSTDIQCVCLCISVSWLGTVWPMYHLGQSPCSSSFSYHLLCTQTATWPLLSTVHGF